MQKDRTTTSISYEENKLDYIAIRAIEMKFNSRNSLIAHILDEWIEKDRRVKLSEANKG